MVTLICACFLSATIREAASLFEDHIDLQKVSEINFRNEKYNVLKPTVHIVRDHFKDFIQKRHNNDFPTNKVYMDKNGFRHYWKGMDAPVLKSLRKTDLTGNDIALSKVDDRDNKEITNKTIVKKDEKVDVNDKAIVKNDNVMASKKPFSTITKITKDGPRRKKRVEPNVEYYVPNKPIPRSGTTEVKTTFFCPFFGVLKMTTYIEGEIRFN